MPLKGELCSLITFGFIAGGDKLNSLLLHLKFLAITV